MIQCKHKRVMLATNLQLETQFCLTKQTFVNDTICLMCTDHDSSEVPLIESQNNFSQRGKEEIKATHNICTGCPMFQAKWQTCKKTGLHRSIPVDTMAQNPSNHCPEGKW